MTDRPDRREYPRGPAGHKTYRKDVDAFLGKAMAKPASDGAAIDAMSQDITELEARFEKLEARVDPVVEVTLESGDRYSISRTDYLALALAVAPASRGEAVDVPLANGDAIMNVRAGELSEIARQILNHDPDKGEGDAEA